MPEAMTWLKKWAWPIVVTVLVLALIVLALVGSETLASSADVSRWLPNSRTVALAVTLFFVAWFLYAFTSCFPGKDWEDRTDGKGVVWERRISMVAFSYLFTIAFLLLPVWSHLHFKQGQHAPPPNTEARKLPIGLVIGCALPALDPEVTPPKADFESVPKELRCDANTAQWVINVGGTIVPYQIKSEPPQPGGESKKLKTPKQDPSVEGIPPEQAMTMTEVSPDPIPVSRISGGLVVPLYFVVLALMGAAVSLARRVPEIQRRSEQDYIGTPTDPKLVPGEVREMLAFQIMQFISAPLVAVTAYHAIGPETKMASVALAFASGFASESILLMIRGIVDGIKPQAKTRPAGTGAASGVVVDAHNKPVANAEVSVVGQPALQAKSNAEGLFVLHAIPIGERVLEATSKPQTAMVKTNIKTGETSTCRIQFA